MADWQFHVDFGDFWHNDEFPIHIKAEIVATRLKIILPDIQMRRSTTYWYMANELEQDIIPRFEELAETKNNDAEDFDDALTQLYDWADIALDNNWGGKKMCWVNTFR